jgi:predicted Zn-dependent peptidase
MKHLRKVLPNGLSVITIPMPALESATVLVMAGAGSRYETKLNNGISHFLEHMAFKGTKKRPSAIEISSLIDAIGGEVNAFTGKEYTGYYIKSASSHIDLSMDILSDMLKNSLFVAEEIEKEKGVIIEEINLYEDMPTRKIDDVYEGLLYQDHPMGWDIAGEKDIIRKIMREDFMSYMASLYSASNLTVVVAGGVTHEKVADLADKYFGDMKKFDTLKYDKVVEKQTEPQVAIKHKKTEQVHIAVGFRTVQLSDPKRRPLAVLAAILGGGMSSRLFNEVREKRGLAYYVRSSADFYQDVGHFSSNAGIDPKRVDEAISVIMDEYAKFTKKSFDLKPDELKKAKEYLKGHLVLDLEDSRSVAIFYAAQEILEDEIKNPDEILARVDRVTAADIEKVAKTFFVQSGLNLAVIGDFEDRQRFEKLLKL